MTYLIYVNESAKWREYKRKPKRKHFRGKETFMPLQFFMGRPQRDGEYVCYIQDRTQPEWMRPIILHRYDGRWFYPKSNNEFSNGIFGWTGPLPVGRLDDPHPPCIQEFDL